MIEYLNFFLLCTLFGLIFYLYIRAKRYLTLLKMAEEIFSSYETPQSDTKRQKLLECILTGNSKLYLGKVYTEEKIKGLSDEEVDKLFNNYKAKLSGQMVKSLGKSIINMYSMGACEALGIRNQDALSEDLESDPFLNSALQRFTCELYYRFGTLLAPLSIGLITSRHYLSECNKSGLTSAMGDSKNGRVDRTEVIAAVISVGVLGFWFGIGAALGTKMVNGLEELIGRK